MAGSERPAHDAVPGLPTHPGQISALVRDAGRYLIGDGTCDAARKLVGAQAFRHAQPDFEAFVASQRDATEVVRVDLEVRGQGRYLHSVYTLVPGPLTLLLICARNCRDGDRVLLRQHTAKCGDLSHEARWPFDVAEAELMTRPAGGVFDELARAGAHRVHSRARPAWRAPGAPRASRPPRPSAATRAVAGAATAARHRSAVAVARR